MVVAKRFLDLQFVFAERARELSGISLETALLDYTNFYVRFGLGRDFDPDHEGWQSYLAGLRAAEDGREWTRRFYLKEPEARTAPEVVATFGCFAYALPSGGHVRLHFRNADADGSPLDAARRGRRRAELAELFAHMKTRVSPDTAVMGASWLYNLRAYRRLFPPGYAGAARPVPGGFRSMALWGQFLDRHGELRESIADPFTSALRQTGNPDDLGRCFPLHALTVAAPVSQFLDFYGV